MNLVKNIYVRSFLSLHLSLVNTKLEEKIVEWFSDTQVTVCVYNSPDIRTFSNISGNFLDVLFHRELKRDEMYDILCMWITITIMLRA